VIDRDLRRALLFIAPYWRRLVLVLALSVLSTALSLYLPLLSRDFFDVALIGPANKRPEPPPFPIRIGRLLAVLELHTELTRALAERVKLKVKK
jgi:ABC-type multidrug transport system fused ATPase/permease subunit